MPFPTHWVRPYWTLTVLPGATYELSFVISSLSLAANTYAWARVGKTIGGYDALAYSIASNGTKTTSFIASASTVYLEIYLDGTVGAGPSTFDIDDVSASMTLTEIETAAVTFKDGLKPRFYLNGGFVSEGDSTVSPDDTATTTLDVGNNNELNDVTAFFIKQLGLGNRPLTDREIEALHKQALVINAK